MSQLRSDIWCSAFLRRHNDLGSLCVVMRRGDPIAGQIWVAIDHLNGRQTLYGPAPGFAAGEFGAGRTFQVRLAEADPEAINERLVREAEFDPDFWLISLETRGADYGLDVYEAPKKTSRI